MKLHVFASQYVHISRFVKEIWLPHRYPDGSSPATFVGMPLADGNEDFFVNLKNGLSYAFTAFTPENIMDLMQRDNLKSFISPGLIIVRRLEVESILEAVEQCLRLTVATGDPLDHYGVRQC